MKVELSTQVADFLRGLAPDPRRQLRAALRGLAEGRGDIIELEHPLDGYCRLRSGRYRVIFRYVVEGRQRSVRCDYAQRRELVYEVFSDLVAWRFGGDRGTAGPAPQAAAKGQPAAAHPLRPRRART